MSNWNLELIYPSLEAFEKDYEELSNELNEIVKYEGRLNCLESLEEFFIFDEKITKKLLLLFSYASMKFDLNQKDIEHQGMYTKVMNLYHRFVTSSSFVNSELLNINLEEYQKYTEKSKILKEHLFTFQKLHSSKEHVLSADKEKLISYYSQAMSNYVDLYSSLSVSDSNSTMIKLSSGEEVEITNSNFQTYLAQLSDSEDRRKVFEAIFKKYEGLKNSYASIYNGILQSNIANMKSRNYNSILESVLEINHIPTQVYLSLIETTKENTQIVKDYIELRKKHLKIDEYHTYDRFLPLAHCDVKYSYENALEEFLKSAKILGDDFYAHAVKALEEGRVDVYPQEGKRTGAYSRSVESVGPFILLNHTDSIEDAFTVAHECGHSMHTLYSNETQPFATKGYEIFVAEIASTFNEQLFLDYLLENSDNDELKICIIENQINGIIGTFYRQSLFADYEYQAHEMALQGMPINYETLGNIIKNLYQRYYGLDITNEKYKEFVWAYIPHLFNTSFYVYQYATSYSASMKIYSDVKNKVPGAFEKYIHLLKQGGSDYPVNLVKEAGVDLTTKEPFIAVCQYMERLVKELEKLLQKRK